ncbi:hypothetical protein McanCB21832_008105, partial [Microsporum canis]
MARTFKNGPMDRGPWYHGTVQNGPPPIVVQGASIEPSVSPESNGTAGTTIRVLLEQMARTFKNGPMGPWTAGRGPRDRPKWPPSDRGPRGLIRTGF